MNCRYFLPFVVLVLSGCGGDRLLLDREALARISSQAGDAHRIVYFDKTFTYTAAGALLEKTSQVTRVGEQSSSYPARMEVYADSTDKLLAVEGRVTHRSGSTETFSTGDFLTYNLSTRGRIAEQFSKRAAIREKLTPGDVIEMVSLHEHILPPLGIDFSLDELAYPADSVNCSIEVGPADSLLFKIANANVVPSISATDGGRRFRFHWDSIKPSARRRHPMEKINQSARILATRMPQSWQTFGDWYLKLAAPKLQAGQALAGMARSITAGKITPKEKMDAIFEYCQRAVRYEQVYFGIGGIIPTDVDAVFSRKYGDCKDYAGLMHAMATVVGVQSHLVLCHRGRGTEFFDDVPMDQFNHAILHFEDRGHDYWYDGTNRVGLPGITTFDLANARGLVLDGAHSRLMTIEESPANSFTVSGTLAAHEDGGLNGRLTVTLSHQYAIEFNWLASRTNKEEMRDKVNRSLREYLNDNIVVDSVTWRAESGSFAITASCELPNSVAFLQRQPYVSVSRILPNLMPNDPDDVKLTNIFYFPYFNRVGVDLRLTYPDQGNAAPSSSTRLELRYQLPPGPFSDTTRQSFLVELESVKARYRQLYAITKLSSR